MSSELTPMPETDPGTAPMMTHLEIERETQEISLELTFISDGNLRLIRAWLADLLESEKYPEIEDLIRLRGNLITAELEKRSRQSGITRWIKGVLSTGSRPSSWNRVVYLKPHHIRPMPSPSKAWRFRLPLD